MPETTPERSALRPDESVRVEPAREPVPVAEPLVVPPLRVLRSSEWPEYPRYGDVADPRMLEIRLPPERFRVGEPTVPEPELPEAELPNPERLEPLEPL